VGAAIIWSNESLPGGGSELTSAQKQEAPLLSVVVPAYNEEENVRRGALQEVVDYLSSQKYVSELIVVDDGSEDDTAALVEEVSSRYPFVSLLRTQHGGKAAAVTAGVFAARGTYISFTDMDQSTPIRFVEDALRELQAGSDVVIGSRWRKGAARLGEPLVRHLLGRMFAPLVRILLLAEITDSQCGFKSFSGKVAHELFSNMKVFSIGPQGAMGPMVSAFDVELLVLAKKRGYRIKEIPVIWRHVSTRRVSPFRDAYRMLKQVAQVWLNNVRGRYDVSGP